MDNKIMKRKADSLAVFRSILDDAAFHSLLTLLEDPSVTAYGEFISRLYPAGDNLSEYIRQLVLQDDNFYVKGIAAKQDMSPRITAAVKSELKILEEIAAITSDDVQEMIVKSDPMGLTSIELPSWTNSNVQLLEDFTKKLAEIPVTGYGIYAHYTFFRIVDGKITPVTSPDYQRLDQLFGYERERNMIIKNTEALVKGTGASNMLLYGDMGTGKSSTIKAAAAAYSDQGLRIIEVKKEQLFQIPDILEQLSGDPLKFILFIDDLSFAGNDDNFSALKATLEGSVSGRSSNVAIFATSNRRHLVKENISDRDGDDLHFNDTLQETMSLSARFGLTITFMRPEQKAYLNIVHSLAREYGINVYDENETTAEEAGEKAIALSKLDTKAEAFAIRHSGRSPRTAKQFIELLKIGL